MRKHAAQFRRLAKVGGATALGLAVFLCLFGLILILATTVEALAPFIYAIF